MAEEKGMDLPWCPVPAVMQKLKAKEETVHFQISEWADIDPWTAIGNLTHDLLSRR